MNTLHYQGMANMNESKNVFEILKWKSKLEITDTAMIEAVNNMVEDLKMLKGFLNQTLYKDSKGFWVDVYYWKSEQDAHASNEIMANKESFINLIEIIEPGSISIEILKSLQSSGEFIFSSGVEKHI